MQPLFELLLQVLLEALIWLVHLVVDATRWAWRMLAVRRRRRRRVCSGCALDLGDAAEVVRDPDRVVLVVCPRCGTTVEGRPGRRSA